MEYAKKHNLDLDDSAIFEDKDVSGSVPALEREGFKDLVDILKDLKQNYPAELPSKILCYEVSRLGRNFTEVVQILEAVENYAPLISTSPKESGIFGIEDKTLRSFLIAVFAFVAARERELLIERTREGIATAHSNNRHSGKLPLGFLIHSCEAQGHDPKRCGNPIRGKLVFSKIGLLVWSDYFVNNNISPLAIQKRLQLAKYKTAYKVLVSIKRFGQDALELENKFPNEVKELREKSQDRNSLQPKTAKIETPLIEA